MVDYGLEIGIQVVGIQVMLSLGWVIGFRENSVGGLGDRFQTVKRQFL
jgi:hypothetical protein